MRKVIAYLIPVFLFAGTITGITLAPLACSTVKAIETDVVDCTIPAIEAVAVEFGPIVKALILSVTGADGSVDWAAIETPLIALAKDDGACVLADVLGELAVAKPVAGQIVPSVAVLHAGFDRYRAKLGKTKTTYKIKTGAL